MGLEISPEKAPVSNILNRSDVQALLKGFIDSSITVLKPDLSPAGDVVYPEAEKTMGASSRTVGEILEVLSNEGLLVRETLTVILACPKCGCTKFVVELTDTYSPTAASRSKVIENIVSGLLGKRLICITGRHAFHENEGVSKKLYCYRFNPEKKSFVEKWVTNLTPVVDSLRAKGWYVESPARIKGRSGVEHTFTLSVTYGEEKEGSADVVVDIIVNDLLVDESALSMVLKAMDVKADKKLLMVVPGLTDKARALFDYYNTYDVHVLEFQSISLVNSALFEILIGMTKSKLKTITEIK